MADGIAVTGLSIRVKKLYLGRYRALATGVALGGLDCLPQSRRKKSKNRWRCCVYHPSENGKSFVFPAVSKLRMRLLSKVPLSLAESSGVSGGACSL